MHANNTSDDRRDRRGATPRFLMAGAAALAAVNMLGVGAFATWTDTEADQLAVASGTLGIVLGADGAANRLSVDAANIAPGDVIQRAVQLTNDGSIDLASIELSTSAANGSLLYTGADRLDLRIKSCDTVWTETVEPSGGYSYTCVGAVNYIVGSSTAYGDVQQAATALTGLNALEAGGVDNLVFDLQLPQSADNTYQDQAETITFNLDAVQRDGTFR